MTIDPVNALALLALAALLAAARRPRRTEPAQGAYFLHDTPTGKAVVLLTLSEAGVRRREGAHLIGPFLTYGEADQRLYDPLTYLPAPHRGRP